MASKGSLYLKNSVLDDIYDTVKSKSDTVEDKFYSQYKIAYKIANSNYFRGDYADSFKSYISNGAVNIITEFMDISSDMTMYIQVIRDAFLDYESSGSGRVGESALDYIDTTLKSKQSTFNSIKSELNSVTALASEYISVKNLSLDSVASGYSDAKTASKNIRNDLYSVDDDCRSSVAELLERINALKSLIKNMLSYCYDSDGNLDTSKLSSITSQDWYFTAGNMTLYLRIQEDPFEYEAGETTFSEDQWAAGLCSDIYIYAGYSIWDQAVESGTDNGSSFTRAAWNAVSATAYGQLTSLLSASVSVDVGSLSIDSEVGYSENYRGFHIDADVGIVDASGSVVLGTDDFNVYVKGSVKFCTASGSVAFEFEDDGEFAIGIKGEATAAEVSGSIGTNIASYKSTEYDSDGNKTSSTSSSLLGGKSSTYDAEGNETVDSLFGINVSGSAGISTGAGIYIESKKVIETSHININSFTVDLNVKFLIGGSVSLTIPYPYLHW